MDKFMHTDFYISGISVYEAYQSAKRIDPVINRGDYALCIIEEGYGRHIFTDGTVMERIPGDIILVPKGSSYHLEVDKPFDTFNISFSLMEDIELKPFLFHAQNNTKLLERFKTAYSIWISKKPGYRDKALSELYQIIHTMKKHYFTDYLPKEKYNVIKPAMEYIHENYHSKRIKVEYLAEMCKITPEYFRDIFKRLYGTSPLDYIQNLQINHAKQLMDSGAYTISEIAEMLGFDELSQFSRKFKKVAGISPKDFKKLKKQQRKTTAIKAVVFLLGNKCYEKTGILN